MGWLRSTSLKSLNFPKWRFRFFFYLFTAGFYFISRYAGRNVTAVVGSTLNFFRIFKGDGCLSLNFGFSTSLDAIAEQDRNRLVEIQPDVSISPYSENFTGSWDKCTNPGQLTSTLNSIQVTVNRLFGSSSVPQDFTLRRISNAVNLVVSDDCEYGLNRLLWLYRCL